MKFDEKSPPRQFEVGNTPKFWLRDCGSMHLAPDEQITFRTEGGAEYDVARKDWGFYATPSLNARLSGFGLRAVLVKNRIGRYFMLLVEQGKDAQFNEYLRVEQLDLICWMDCDAALARLEAAVRRT